ncbi:YigZ family protein [Myxococcota bacterium]|nr:YigZ family protein [Myxococcota bacterium]MBU1432348.1 YigZ family protein [Myxococcota bacterium]MBU1896377.1 YigZ family protein [Myxococcota bacterium]
MTQPVAPPTLRRPARRAQAELPPIHRSRFIGDCAPIEDAEAAMAFVREIRAAHLGARHVAFAWRLSDQPQDLRYSDDGEPTGSAGTPMMRILERRGLEGVVVTVTRYYGGVKLGTGGLARAYGEAAAAALDEAGVIETLITAPFELRCGYSDLGSVEDSLKGFNVTRVEADYGVEVWLSLRAPADEIPRLRALIDERLAARVRWS